MIGVLGMGKIWETWKESGIAAEAGDEFSSVVSFLSSFH